MKFGWPKGSIRDYWKLLLGMLLVLVGLLGNMNWIAIAGFGLMVWQGLTQKKKMVYVKAIKGESNTIYGPYRTLEEADWDTSDLECDEIGAFKDRPTNQKGAVRIHLLPEKKWWD